MVQKCLVGHNRRWVITLCVCRACGKVEGVWGLGRKQMYAGTCPTCKMKLFA